MNTDPILSCCYKSYYIAVRLYGMMFFCSIKIHTEIDRVQHCVYRDREIDVRDHAMIWYELAIIGIIEFVLSKS